MQLVKDALHVSTEVAEAAASERTEFDVRLDRIRELARASQEAKERFYAIRAGDAPKDEESAEYFQWKAGETKLCRAHIRAEKAYHTACDEFFMNRDERGRK